MTIKQLTVFVQNSKGSLVELTKILGHHNINIRALSVAETQDFGILRLIVNDVETAMKVLQENNIPTHFLEQIDQNCTLVKRAEMIPVEVVVHNYTAGSMCRRLGLEAHKKLKFPVMEFCYKNDELNDPVINEYHAYAMGLCTQEEMTIMTYNAMRVNKVLCDLFDSIGMVVADFKLEFGRVGNFLVVADEITPNVGRFWEKDSMSRIKYTLGSAEKEYEIILERLKQAAKDLL